MVIAARVVTDAPLVITQGSYNTSVSASAGTHSGGGAVDFRARDLNDAQVAEALLKLRHVGFAAWHRLPEQGPWVEHVHAIAIGCPDLSASAADQVVAYGEGRNGLANNRADDGPRTYVGWTWEKYKKAYPDLLTEDVVQQADIDKIVAAVVAKVTPVVQAYSAFNAKNLTQQLTTLLANTENLDQKYAVAVNNYVKQLDVENDADVAALKVALAAATAKVDTVTSKVDAVKTVVDALPKAQ